MERVLYIVSKLFNKIFVDEIYGSYGVTAFGRVIYLISNNPYLMIGTICLIVGFVIGIVNRLIKN